MTSVLDPLEPPDPLADAPAPEADVMQVCLNGHVITALLYSRPGGGQSHCDRCGAETLERCRTCGAALRGGVPSLGLDPIGQPRPPAFCAVCGACFPWASRIRPGHHPSADPLARLESLLRRFPLVARQLRDRHGDRPAFRVADDHDVEDLVRALLPVHFDQVRQESRTPSYSRSTRVDFCLPPDQAPGDAEPRSAIAVTVKLASLAAREPELTGQWREDLAYYQARRPAPVLVGFVYDPQGCLHNPAGIELAWARLADGRTARGVIAV